MDFITSSKNVGSSAFGSSGNGAASSTSGNGLFSNFFNLSIQKIVLLLAIIAFIISIGTVAVLLWKSKSSQKWPPEIAKCPDRMDFDGTKCVDNYGLLGNTVVQPPSQDNCTNFSNSMNLKYAGTGLNNVDDSGYIPWEGIIDGQKSRASSLKCLS